MKWPRNYFIDNLMKCIILAEIYVLPIKYQCSFLTHHPLNYFIDNLMKCIILAEIYVLPIKYQCSFLTHHPLGDMAMKNAIAEYILRIKCMSMSDEIALCWMPNKTFDEKSTLVQIMAWWRKATSHYLSQCWPRSMLPCGINSLVYSSGYFCRGRSRMQVKIVADSFVKLHLLTR